MGAMIVFTEPLVPPELMRTGVPLLLPSSTPGGGKKVYGRTLGIFRSQSIYLQESGHPVACARLLPHPLPAATVGVRPQRYGCHSMRSGGVAAVMQICSAQNGLIFDLFFPPNGVKITIGW